MEKTDDEDGGLRGFTNCDDIIEAINIWVFPKIGVGPQNVWFIRENPTRNDDLRYPYFWKHPYIYILTYVSH